MKFTINVMITFVINKNKKTLYQKIWCNTQIFKLPIRIPAKAAKYHLKFNHEKESKRLQQTFAKSVLQLKCMHSRKSLSSMACVIWFSHVLRTTGASKLHALQKYRGFKIAWPSKLLGPYDTLLYKDNFIKHSNK